MRTALTMVSVWPFGEPVRGRLETMRIVPVRLPPAAGLGDGETAGDGDAAGLAAGLAAGDAAGLAAAAAGDAAGDAGGLVAAAGAAGGAAGPPHATTNRLVANDSDDKRASSAPRIDEIPPWAGWVWPWQACIRASAFVRDDTRSTKVPGGRDTSTLPRTQSGRKNGMNVGQTGQASQRPSNPSYQRARTLSNPTRGRT